MYRFDAEEPATVKIRILPSRYVTINDKCYHLTKEFKPNPVTQKWEMSYNYDQGELWVPQRIAKELVTPQGKDKERGIVPMAEIVETREANQSEKRPGRPKNEGVGGV